MIRLIGTLAAIYVLVLGALYLLQRNLMYFPDRTRPAPATFGVGELAAVTLSTADGLDLVAWWRAPEAEGAPVVVFFHGNAGHIGNRGFKGRPFLDQVEYVERGNFLDAQRDRWEADIAFSGVARKEA